MKVQTQSGHSPGQITDDDALYHFMGKYALTECLFLDSGGDPVVVARGFLSDGDGNSLELAAMRLSHNGEGNGQDIFAFHRGQLHHLCYPLAPAPPNFTVTLANDPEAVRSGP